MHTLYKNFKHKIVYRRHEWSKLPKIHEGNTVRIRLREKCVELYFVLFQEYTAMGGPL